MSCCQSVGWGQLCTPDSFCCPQMHIVHMNAKYQTLAEAKGHPNGLAVLGFFFQVGLQGLPRNWVLVVQPGKHCAVS